MDHSSEIITSPVYVAPSWRWIEVPQFSFSNCSLVSYMPSTDCRFPVTKIRDSLDSSTIECLISLGRMQGSLNALPHAGQIMRPHARIS